MGTKKFEYLNLRRYQDVRPEIRTGDIFFASGNYPFSKMIRHFSDSMLSHVGFVFTWNSRVLLLESVEVHGVRVVPLSRYVEDYNNSGRAYDGRLFLGRYRDPLDMGKIDQMLGKAADILNRKYDVDEITEMLARLTLGLGAHKDDDAYICSEFVDVCFKEIGINFPRDTRGFVFPEHIAADDKVQALFEIGAGT